MLKQSVKSLFQKLSCDEASIEKTSLHYIYFEYICNEMKNTEGHMNVLRVFLVCTFKNAHIKPEWPRLEMWTTSQLNVKQLLPHASQLTKYWWVKHLILILVMH